MNRKKTPAAGAKPASSTRRNVVVASGIALTAAAVGGVFYFNGRAAGARASRPELVGAHAPSLGDAAARVHIVEFLDPACETCAAFYPIVHKLVDDHPGRIRLTMRHVPLHPGVAPVVAMLEASRAQDRYWQALQALFAEQDRWVVRHVAQPDVARQVLARAGLDMARLDADLRSSDVAQRMALDRADATALNVEQTPEYFVNGRQMASFGRRQLLDLVQEELRDAY